MVERVHARNRRRLPRRWHAPRPRTGGLSIDTNGIILSSLRALKPRPTTKTMARGTQTRLELHANGNPHPCRRWCWGHARLITATATISLARLRSFPPARISVATAAAATGAVVLDSSLSGLGRRPWWRLLLLLTRARAASTFTAVAAGRCFFRLAGAFFATRATASGPGPGHLLTPVVDRESVDTSRPVRTGRHHDGARFRRVRGQPDHNNRRGRGPSAAAVSRVEGDDLLPIRVAEAHHSVGVQEGEDVQKSWRGRSARTQAIVSKRRHYGRAAMRQTQATCQTQRSAEVDGEASGRTERDAARHLWSTRPCLPDRTPPVARCAPEEPLLLLEDDRLLPPLRRKESSSDATTGLVTGNLAWGVMYCSEMPIGSCDGGGETPQSYPPRSVFGNACVRGYTAVGAGRIFFIFGGGDISEKS